MRQNIEQRLNQLTAPEAPRELRERCLATIPQEAHEAPQSPAPHPTRTPRTLQRLVFAGAILSASLIGFAFWSTQPPSDKNAPNPGAIALAQTVKAMQKVGYVHITAQRVKATQLEDAHLADWYKADGWYDATQGQYWTATPTTEAQPIQTTQAKPAQAHVTSKLQLPDGTAYVRSGTTLTISKSPQKWQSTKRALPLSLLGNAALMVNDTSTAVALTPADLPRLSPPKPIQWKGQPAKLIQLEVSPSSKALGTRTNLYIDAKTDRVLEMQEFAVKQGVPDRMIVQAQADYQRPAATLFDSSKIRVGITKIEHVKPKAEAGTPTATTAVITTAPITFTIQVPFFVTPIPADMNTTQPVGISKTLPPMTTTSIQAVEAVPALRAVPDQLYIVSFADTPTKVTVPTTATSGTTQITSTLTPAQGAAVPLTKMPPIAIKRETIKGESITIVPMQKLQTIRVVPLPTPTPGEPAP